MLIKDADIVGWGPWLRFVWKGHISNWLWRDSRSRRLTRQKYYSEMKGGYFKKYHDFVANLHAPDRIPEEFNPEEEKYFSLWFQGRDKAPDIVKKCFQSIERVYGDKLIILDEESMTRYIELPDYIMKKWKEGRIIPANFSDIVRIELLTRYGGYWFDATDLLISPIPDVIRDADFFMYVTSPELYTHMFVQTCFMRAKKGDPLIRMWRDLVFEYWRHENRSADYFLVHMLFKYLVTTNKDAKRLFEQMPKLYQDHIHYLWYDYGNLPYKEEYLGKMRENAFFQKCSYRKLKHTVSKILPGSTADVLTRTDSSNPLEELGKKQSE